jgi:hypothetical protein
MCPGSMMSGHILCRPEMKGRAAGENNPECRTSIQFGLLKE